jgi:Arc/MetJ-type ribon-helix-helix transcriptional regulator
LEAEVPERLLGEMQALVAEGWFRNVDEIVLDALRRFVESHRSDLMEHMVREDVEWGLRGAD